MKPFQTLFVCPQLILIFLVVVFSEITYAQKWQWVERTDVLNPSGIPVSSNDFQFKVLDWNNDGSFDFFINESGNLTYYEQTPGESPSWFARGLNLPKLGFIDTARRFPKNFEFIDWDADGDFELAADSSRFWWNQGSNLAPRWVRDDSLLNGIAPGVNFFFSDYDGDGDWDALSDVLALDLAAFYLNQGNNQQPVWSRKDTIIDFGAVAQFVSWNSDNRNDLVIVEPLATVGGGLWAFGIAGYVNDGTLWAPNWQYLQGLRADWVSHNRDLFPAYDLADTNHDALIDIVKTDWQRHIAIHLNRGTVDSSQIDLLPNSLLGPVNVESHAAPFFYDIDTDGHVDLLVTGDFLIDFFAETFAGGRVHTFKNLGGHFDPGVSIAENVPPVSSQPYPNFRKGFTLSFADIDHDGDQDFLFGFIKTNMHGETTGRGMQFFRNTGTQAQPDWQVDVTAFCTFLDPDTVFYADSLFYAPVLIDIDHDNDFDVFLQKDGRYVFYERLNTPEESWQKNSAWEIGLNLAANHSATFADITRDGLEDLIFGKTDGTLELYENTGSRLQPNWSLVEGTFAGIEVDSLAAPAFADLNDDTIFDLIVGSANGRLVYFENASTVDVATADEPFPVRFQLHQNYPNPFNPATTIRYDLPAQAQVRLTIFDVLGRTVRTLVSQKQPAGAHSAIWNGRDNQGQQLASGLYLYRLEAGAFSNTAKMLLLK